MPPPPDIGIVFYGLLIQCSFDWRRILPMLVEAGCLSARSF